MVSVTLSLVRTVEIEGFQVRAEVTASTEIPAEIFVYRTASDVFDHVATPVDLTHIGTDGLDTYYRTAVALRVFADVSDAVAFVESLVPRVRALVRSHAVVVDEFVGSDVEVITS